MSKYAQQYSIGGLSSTGKKLGYEDPLPKTFAAATPQDSNYATAPRQGAYASGYEAMTKEEKATENPNDQRAIDEPSEPIPTPTPASQIFPIKYTQPT